MRIMGIQLRKLIALRLIYQLCPSEERGGTYSCLLELKLRTRGMYR
jgi:hypothetical protein